MSSAVAIIKKQKGVIDIINKHWDEFYSPSLPYDVSKEDVKRVLFNLMRKSGSNFSELSPAQMMNFALDTVGKGYDPEMEHVYPIIYKNQSGTVLESQKGYKGVLYDLERAGIYATYDLVHKEDDYYFDKFDMKIHHKTMRSRVNRDYKWTIKDNSIVCEHDMDKIWVAYRNIKTKEVIDIFEMYIDEAIEHGLKYTKANPIKQSKAGGSYIDKNNNWVKNTKAMVIKTALLQGAKTLPKTVEKKVPSFHEDNQRWQEDGKVRNAWEDDRNNVDADIEEFEEQEMEQQEIPDIEVDANGEVINKKGNDPY